MSFYSHWNTGKVSVLPALDIYRSGGCVAVYFSWICLTVGFYYVRG